MKKKCYQIAVHIFSNILNYGSQVPEATNEEREAELKVLMEKARLKGVEYQKGMKVAEEEKVIYIYLFMYLFIHIDR